MKKFELTKEQLSYLHSIDSVKETIEEWFPSEFPKLEDGKWHIYPNSAIQFNKKDGIGYGIQSNGNWVNTASWLGIKHNGNFRLATPQEVEEALTKEIEKRYTIGSRIKCLYNSEISTVEQDDLVDYYYEQNEAYYAGVRVFKDGIFTEIVSEPIEVTLEEIAKLKGVDVSQIKIVK